jgi:nicotinamidase-related amidase
MTARPTLPDSAHTALLVIDMQEYFRGIAGPIIANLSILIEAVHTAGWPVFYTQHGHDDPSADGGMLGQWWGDLIGCSF